MRLVWATLTAVLITAALISGIIIGYLTGVKDAERRMLQVYTSALRKSAATGRPISILKGKIYIVKIGKVKRAVYYISEEVKEDGK